MKVMIRLLMIIVLFTSVPLNPAWSASAGPERIQRERAGVDRSTGFYGGIKHGKLLLILSKQGGARYYDVAENLMVTGKGGGVEISNLPVNTPIQVTSEFGKVAEVRVREVGK